MQYQSYYDYFKNNQNSSLPFTIEYDSGEPGEHIMFVGSLHGHEPAGTIAGVEIHKLLISGKIKLKSGKVSFVLGNPDAFLDNQRFIYKNLNRVFLDDIEKNVEGVRVAEFRTYFQNNHVDYLLDLHSVSNGDFKFIIYFDEPELKKIAFDLSPINTHLIVNVQSLPGSLMQEASKYGTKSLALECGNNADPKTVDVAKYHIISSMIYFQLIVKDYKFSDIYISDNKICLYTVIDYIKPGIGFKFLDPLTTTGSFVKKGQTYAKLANGFEYKTQIDSYIVIPDLNPNPNDHDAGFLCTKDIIERFD